MNDKKRYSIEELKKVFKILADLKIRAYEIAPLCTNITSREEITGMWADGDTVEISVWSSDCGCDGYEFPLEYFSMTTDEIQEVERKKAEQERIRMLKEEKREAKRKKKATEAAERREYERLRKKFG